MAEGGPRNAFQEWRPTHLIKDYSNADSEVDSHEGPVIATKYSDKKATLGAVLQLCSVAFHTLITALNALYNSFFCNYHLADRNSSHLVRALTRPKVKL